MSTWLALHTLRTFPSWYLATCIKVALPGSCYAAYVYIYISWSPTRFPCCCSCSLKVHSKTRVYFVGNLGGSLSSDSGRCCLTWILPSYKSFLHQRQEQSGMHFCSVLEKRWGRRRSAHWLGYGAVHAVLAMVACGMAHLHRDLTAKWR